MEILIIFVLLLLVFGSTIAFAVVGPILGFFALCFAVGVAIGLAKVGWRSIARQRSQQPHHP